MVRSASNNGPTKKQGAAARRPANKTARAKTNATPATIYEQLRLRIAIRAYEPGVRLSETDLATEFGLSRTPVRQALQLLAADGLVNIKNGVGVTVTDLDRNAIDQAYHLRCELAAMIGDNWPLPLNPAQIEEVEAVRCAVVVLLKRGGRIPLEEFSELCERFHNVVNHVIGSQMLRQFIEVLYHQTDRFWFGWMAHADIRTEVTHFLHEVEETQRALEIEDFEAVGYIRRNHISMMLARMAQFREMEKPVS